MMRRLAPPLLALALLACGKDAPPPVPLSEKLEPAPPATRAGEQPASRPAPTGFVARVAKPGVAYFAVDGAGLVRLREGAFTVLPRVSGLIRLLALSREGLWYSNVSGLYVIFDDQTPRKIGDFDMPGSIDELVISKEIVWTIGYKGLSRYDGKGWTLIDKAKLGNPRVLRGLAVDKDGRAWVTTARAILRQAGERFDPVDTSEAAGESPFFDRAVSGGDGHVYVSFAGGLLRCGAEGCRRHGALATGPSAFAVSADGRALLVHSLNRLSLLSPKGEQTAIDPDLAGMRARAVRRVVADEAGRFWLATDFGVVILDRDLKAVQWEPGQVTELQGEILAIALEGQGPDLPVVGPRATGTVHGRVLRGGVPVAGATVEICESPSVASATPCAQAIFAAAATTDADGAFTLTHVPVGPYRFAVRPSAKSSWTITVAGGCCNGLRDGHTFYVGTINLREQ